MSAELDQLDAMMRETFNCSFDDFMRELIKRFDNVLEEARAKSYSKGVSDGLQAKNKSDAGIRRRWTQECNYTWPLRSTKTERRE
jgi:hypothetical protein